jgi:hypothetical protein
VGKASLIGAVLDNDWWGWYINFQLPLTNTDDGLNPQLLLNLSQNKPSLIQNGNFPVKYPYLVKFPCSPIGVLWDHFSKEIVEL